mgnify:FL=1|jgi:hypothetical protein
MIDIKKISEPLRIEQIEFRVGHSSGQNHFLLAYKDARVDMDRLDAVCGHLGWQRKHELIDGQLFCHVGIYDESINQWVWKSDVGVESRTEAEKGRSSDAFKRACFNWGIGRELYDLPLIIVKSDSTPKPQYWTWEAQYHKGSSSSGSSANYSGRISGLRAIERGQEKFSKGWVK